MTPTSRRAFLALSPAIALAIALVAVGARPAHADMSKKVIAAFKGKILVTDSPLEMVGDDKTTIAAFKKSALTEVKGAPGADDVMTWVFVYNAFLNKTGATNMKLEFYDGKNYSADKSLTGVDPKLTVLQGDIEITEDDNITKGKTYTLKLTGMVKGKELTFATGQIKMN
jgi:hypothetical protein